MLARIAATIIFLVAGIAALGLSALVFGLLLLLGIGFAGWMWWQRRRLMRNDSDSGMIIESTEFTVIKDESNRIREKDVD